MMKSVIGIFGLLLAMSANAVTYEDEFTEKKGSAYHEDINVWVYTTEFAKRFGMPDRWIDDELKGAYAAAFRVEEVSGGMLLPNKGPSASIPIRRCILDVYLPSDAELPWVDDREVGIRYKSPSSPKYLMPQSEKDKAYKSTPVGFTFFGNPVMLKSIDGGFSTLTAIKFDKALYPGVTFISFTGACTTPPKVKTWIEFRKSRQSKKLYHKVDIPQPPCCYLLRRIS